MQSGNYYQPPQPMPTQQQPGRSVFRRVLPWLLIVLVVAGLVVFGAKALRDKRVADEMAPYDTVFADNVSIDGIQLGGMTAQQAYDRLYAQHQNRVNGWQLQLKYQDHIYYTVSYETLGIQVNTDQLNAMLKQAWDVTHTGDAYARKEAMEALVTQPLNLSTTRSALSDRQLEQILTQIADNISSFSQPEDARLIQFVPTDVRNPFLIQAEKIGYSLDIQAAREQIMALASSGTSGVFELQPEPVYPKVTEADIRKNLALRSTAFTAISRNSEENRTNNIRVSMDRINGTILKPGEVFSFNKVVGRRTIRNGFYEALEMVYGDLVTGIGGGVCQPSSTLFQAALLAGLGITDRSNHSEPVNYTDRGLDATVYWVGDRQIDFKFKNTTSSDLYISALVKLNPSNSKQLITEVRLYGEPLEDNATYKLKTVDRQVLEPPEPKMVLDRKADHVIYEDETWVQTKARKGYIVDTFLEKYVNNKLVEGEQRLVAESTYPVRQEIIWTGVTPR